MSATLIADLPRQAEPAAVAPLHRALAQAPLGAYPLLEAAFAWQELRPSGWHRPGTAAVAHTSSAAAAARLASLLSTLTWANVVRTERDGLRVEVPAGSYNRITRALTGAWRNRSRLLAATPAAADARQAALGLWRMALLTGGVEARPGRLTVRAGSSAAAQALVAAAARLGLEAVTDGPREGAHLVRVAGPQVHQLLSEATGVR
ncbi:hypothetical protein [Catellatospora sp. NPDC049609]|uniref:hypothetical protein n=1 Tax=Catellatospora sp. NPDC049609 TaxID=3155505 RepID=UPI003443F3DD